MLCVVGLGYIGLPTALMLAANGSEVVGVDCLPEVVASLRQKRLTFREDGMAELFDRALERGIAFTTEYPEADVYIISVPTPYDQKSKKVNMDYVAAAVKQVVKIPILCGGRMNDPDLAAQAIAQGKLDAVVLGRPSLADPAYPQKVATGRPEDIRPCIGCNQGCIGALKVGRRAGCAVNPQAAREASFALTPAPRKKSVLVVGGGVAGMEAARCAALRGHDVTLCEGSDRLGGNLIPAGAHPFKEELNELNRWYQGQLAQLGVTVELGVRLTAREIQDRSPDAVVLAVGAAPAVPPVPGIDSPKVIDCVTALTGPDLPGQRVLVVGGGLVGCETALGYAQAGKQVTILEALPDILSAGIPVPEMNDSMLRDLLDEAGVVRRTGRRLSRVTEDGAVADGPDGEEKLPADHIVLAVGFTPRTSLAPELAGAGMEVYQVGDGSRVGSVMTAIGSAYTVGRML